MRFLMMMIPAVYQNGPVPADFAPPADAVEQMMKFNEELAKAGALIALDGLTPIEKGARVAFGAAGLRTTTDGPFLEAKEVVGGYWIIRAASKEEAVAWAEKVPAGEGDVVEVRPIFDLADFPEDVQKAAENEAVSAAIGR